MALEKKARINDEINVREVRVIDDDGEQLGIMALADAKAVAAEQSLDLVEISPNVSPPVCRIMDYGKYLYQNNKKKQEAKRKQKTTSVKEVKFRPGTDIGDYTVKMRNVTRFLEEGNKVKVTLRFRGREMAHPELGSEMLKRVEEDSVELATVEQRPRMEGRQMVMVLAPKRS
ncbi:translation initiation factor IF-3 [Gammaproteobacteria bacterium]|nr:translation initiation factor IF-3 [Gammaproteobacteria bacterium]